MSFSLSSDSSLHMERIAEKLAEGKVALFIGAGVSKVAGAPSTSELVALIKKKFNKARFRTDDFSDVCQAVIDSDYYDGRRELEDLIRRTLGNLQPTEWHHELPKLNLAAIFTTNYDDLIEESFRLSTHSPKRDYYSVLTDNFTIADRKTLYIFKLMGTIRARSHDPGRMVLSKVDVMSSLRMKEKCIDVLSDIIRDGTVVFVGYSGRDQVVFEVMERMAQKYGVDSLMRSYMLLHDLSCIEGESLKFSRRNIVPVKCSFQELIEFLLKKPMEKGPPAPQRNMIRVSGHDMKFAPREINPCSNFFFIMGEKDLDQPPGNKDDFFRGINRSWGAFREKWDFQRDTYIDENGFRERISNELKKMGPSDNRVLMVAGVPGIGKSMMLRRTAYDSYRSGFPTLIFDSTKSKFDFKILDSFLMDIDRKLYASSEGRIANAKSIIILDDVASLLVNPVDVSAYLSSRGRSALIITSARGDDLSKEFGIAEKDIVKIPQKLTKNEIHRLAHHLRQIGYLPSSEIWANVILRELERSFFAAMYTLVDPAKRPLGKIIYDQFADLTEEQKKIFLCICAFHRFNLPITIELLVRVACNNNYDLFMKCEKDRRLKQITSKTEDRDKNILYTSHNRIIAQKTFDLFLNDNARRKELYLDILDKTHFSIGKERELVEKLLILNFGPKRRGSRLSLSDRLELFSTICSRTPTKSLLHHFGLLQAELKDFSNAEKTLLKALGFREMYLDAYYGESNRNIQTSLGCMYIDWAEEKITTGDVESAEELFPKAERYLHDAMKYHYPAPHPYHALARMYMRRGDRLGEDPRRFEHYANALDVIDIGKRNVHAPRGRELYTLETMIQTQLENEEAIKEAISVLEDKYRSPRGRYLYCTAVLAKCKSLRAREKREALEGALRVLDEGLYKFPTDEPCLRVKAEIIKTLHPREEKMIFEALERWHQMSRWHSVELLFELAVAAFKLSYYDTSFKRFAKLERVSRGHPERFTVREYMKNGKGQRIVYRGTILRIRSPYEGEIRVDSLPRLDYNIRFAAETCTFIPKEGDVVSFLLGFNYVSPQAIDVRKEGA